MKRFFALTFLVGCAGDTGALGNTAVTQECSPTDFACVTAGLDGPIAVGGVVPLSIDTDTLGTSTASMSLLSADPTVIKAAGTEVVGMSPGVAALVMLSGGSAIDFLHVFVATPTRIGLNRSEDGLSRGELVEDLELLVDDEVVIEALPYNDSQRLLGHGSSTWTAGPEVAVLKEGTPGRRRIVARTVGETDLVVSEFGFDKTLHITVLP